MAKNVWFQESADQRKSCPDCYGSLGGKSYVIQGSYAKGRWYRVQALCEACWPEVRARIIRKADEDVNFQARSGYTLPTWLH
jgi:formate dehydrogenase maturation protein FdhE